MAEIPYVQAMGMGMEKSLPRSRMRATTATETPRWWHDTSNALRSGKLSEKFNRAGKRHGIGPIRG